MRSRPGRRCSYGHEVETLRARGRPFVTARGGGVDEFLLEGFVPWCATIISSVSGLNPTKTLNASKDVVNRHKRLVCMETHRIE